MRPLYLLSGGLCLIALNLALAGGSAVKKEDVPKYIAILQKPGSPSERATAAEMIGKRGSINVKDVVEAVGPLQKALKDKDATVRTKAATALGMIGTEADTTVPLLIDLVKNDKSQQVQLAAVASLGRYGREAKDAVPTIRDFGKNFTEKKDKTNAMTVKSAISEITGQKKKK